MDFHTISNQPDSNMIHKNRFSIRSLQKESYIHITHTQHSVLVLLNSSGVVNASASSAVDSALILSRVTPMPVKSIFTPSMLYPQHYGDSLENKPASLLVVRMEKVLSGILPSGSGRQVAGKSQASLL